MQATKNSTPSSSLPTNVSQSRRIELAKAEKWHRGDPSYLLHSGQKKIDLHYKSSPGQIFVANISRQWGKSYWAVVKALVQCLKHPKSRVKYGTAFETDLKEFIMPAFDKILEDCPASIRPKYKTQGAKWVFPNGSEIKLAGLDRKPDGLRGNSIDLIIIDEAGFVTNLEYVYKSTIIPATLHRPNCKVILISTPPRTPAHPYSDFFIPKAELEGSYVKLTIYDNPLISEADIERMAKEVGGKRSTTFRREFLCELILDDDMALVPEWKDELIQELPRDQYFTYYHKLVGQDLGRVDNTALVFGHYDFKRAALVIEDELTMNGPEWTTKTLKDAINSKEKELWPEWKAFRRVSDNNNPHLLKDLGSIHNIHFMPVVKESSLEQMVNRVREWTKDGRIIIHPRCKMLIGCMRHGVWDKHRKAFERSKTFGHFDHFAALMYLLIHTPAASNPIPRDHGFVNHKAWLGNIKGPDSHNARVLGQLLGPKKSKNV